MRKILPLIFAVVIFDSCCIRNKTFPQSDRFDTHHPNFPVIECKECGDLKNSNEGFFTTEALGPSGGLSFGIELGHNYNNLRIYGSAGVSYWPFRPPTTTFSGQFGIVLFNPNFIIRPEIGIGYADWMINGKQDGLTQLHPSLPKALVGKGSYQSWQAYGGLRIKIPYSSIDLGLRVYKIETLKPTGYNSWYPGIICGFRF